MAALQDLAAFTQAVSTAYVAKFGDLADDVVTVEALEQVLGDFGVPDMGLAQILTEALGVFLKARAAAGPDPGQYWFYHPGPTMGR
jgi:hypothetical protein